LILSSSTRAPFPDVIDTLIIYYFTKSLRQLSSPFYPFFRLVCFYLWLHSPLLGLGRFLSFLILHTVGRTPIHRATQTQNKQTQTSMPPVGFEPKITAFERAKTVHASDCVTTVVGSEVYT
jgi:hypothetical protein